MLQTYRNVMVFQTRVGFLVRNAHLLSLPLLVQHKFDPLQDLQAEVWLLLKLMCFVLDEKNVY
jgi:hypothetical protein